MTVKILGQSEAHLLSFVFCVHMNVLTKVVENPPLLTFGNNAHSITRIFSPRFWYITECYLNTDFLIIIL